jgi:pyrophosphate--fructose-6-phosphate 1-phosphotransferase
MIEAGKVLIQKSGYYSRAAAANDRDLELIKACVDKAVETALAGGTGLVGHDEDQGDELRAIEFDRIKGGKNFDIDADWFGELLEGIGQPKRAKVVVAH